MSENAFAEKLLDFGFSFDEARIYVLLVQQGSSPASLAARRLRMNRVKVYRNLRALEAKGAVSTIPGRPLRFIAAPFNEVARRIIEEEKKKISVLERESDEIHEGLESFQTESADHVTRMRLLQGRKQIYEFLIQLLERIQNEVCLITTNNDLKRLSYYGIDDLLREKDVTVRILTPANQSGMRAIEDFGDVAEIRHIEMPSTTRFVIADEDEVLITFSMDDSMSMTTRDDTALWTNAGSYVKTMIQFFASVWNIAPNGRLVIEAIQRGKIAETQRIIGTPDELKATIRAMVDASRNEGYLMWKNLETLPINLDVVLEAARRGVRFKILTDVRTGNPQALDRLQEVGQILHSSRIEMEILLVDDREMLVQIARAHGMGFIAWSSLRLQIDNMKQVFTEEWEAAVPADAIRSQINIEKRLQKGLNLAGESLRASGWRVEMPGHIVTQTGETHAWSLKARSPDTPSRTLLIDILNQDSPISNIVRLHRKSSEIGNAIRLLISENPFHPDETSLAQLYDVKLLDAETPQQLAAKITLHANES